MRPVLLAAIGGNANSDRPLLARNHGGTTCFGMSAHVVVVDDHAIYRDTLVLALKATSSVKIVGTAGSAHEAHGVIEQMEPDLVLADFMLPDGNGIALARELKRRRVRSRVLILGRLNHPEFIRDSLGYVDGFVHKNEPLAKLIEAIDCVVAGKPYLSPRMESNLETELDVRPGRFSHLSAREREILFLLLQGLSSKEIGARLFLSSKTVDAHRLHINRKLGVRSQAALSRILADEGLMSL
jgi:DNA-binding NarL/FixJ family response regulator